jgi:hypothetical protein
MDTASFQGVLKVILIVLLIYFGFKILIRWFGPIILRYFLRKIGSKFQQKFNPQAHKPGKKKGEVVIEKKPKGGSKPNKNVGEYIDYEEID